ncbi:sensor domain-containing diguanylate cyclase [Colwellia echini]|uniref:diguanylate cyclase n=1 Tax=Colwellia echini TaxID=1982103 RepID=A0ABY3N179_9GAMM|nr:diguanylate cyclase [Colwellia echini]TYK67248.1 GGDEF domain-containing protein [Colwellia echini]
MCSFCSLSKAIEISTSPQTIFINEYLDILQSRNADLSFQQALQHFQDKKFTANLDNKVSFGSTNNVVWASLVIKNTSTENVNKLFYIDSAWLDRAEFYFLYNDNLIGEALIGDLLPFDSRVTKTRMFSVQHTFAPASTVVLMKFQSQDPLLIPIFLSTNEIVNSNLTLLNYFYGFIYGAFFILLVYNIALSLSLKDSRYVYYSLYLLSFFCLNLSYTGHGYKFLWSGSVFLQQWLMPLFLYLYILFGIAFCFEFLKLKVFLPKVYKRKKSIYAGLILLVILLFIIGDRLLAVQLGVALTSLLVVIFISLGVMALKHGHKMAKFFIPAVLMGAGGAAISAATTWGIIPYNTMLFHGIEIGMLLEMSLLAVALGFNLKEMNNARIIAEVNAQIDPLTTLFNRRAFAATVEPQWHLGIRDNKPFSLILLDIDWFKRINDDYGHAAGDTTLKAIAETLNRKVRKSDILARWGGEEFIIFLPNTSKLSATNLANVIRQEIERMTVLHTNVELKVTASFGVADHTVQQNKLEDLIKLADDALYKAKSSGRNIVCTA